MRPVEEFQTGRSAAVRQLNHDQGQSKFHAALGKWSISGMP
jgi:hypothetical protein